MNRIAQNISQRLSLRKPQQESLEILTAVLDRVPLEQGANVSAALAEVQALCPTVTDFERSFPSLCFGLATGVGKTRLMGAFIAYLHLAKRVRNFFVLAPNLTIYEKLKSDFDPGFSRYVLTGLGEFAQNRPLVINGENYDTKNIREFQQGRTKQGTLGFDSIHINIFNISKLNSEVRGGKEPRIKRLREYLGESYFNYLMALPDLVLLMDESHRYRAERGMQVLNELKPVLGLEMTATPFVESAKGIVAFKNVAYSYPLSSAIRDGFVKKPVALTRRDFKKENYDEAELERVKLEDAIRVHESVKVDLDLYHREAKKPMVKPFVLVVAQNVAHAETIKQLITSESFFEGRYKGKVIRVDSGQKGDERDETIEHLLAVEDPADTTEVVIHVNMLKEGWDVRNLYVIVPLRAADARTLVEQTVGRGLRLPFGELTGRDSLDRLTIVAHDRFDELIEETGRADSLIRGGLVIGKDIPEEGYTLVTAPPVFTMPSPEPAVTEGGSSATEAPVPVTGTLPGMASTPTPPRPALNVPKAEYDATLRMIAVAANQPTHYPTVEALTSETGLARLNKQVQASLSTSGYLQNQAEEMQAHVAKVAQRFVETVIGIPRVRVLPSGEVTCGVTDFELDVSSVHFQSVEEALFLKYLQDQSRQEIIAIQEDEWFETTLERDIVKRLIDFDDIDYMEMGPLLFKLAGQMADRLRSLHADEAMVKRVGRYHLGQIVRLIHVQLQAHFWENPTSYQTFVDGGFTYPEQAGYKHRSTDGRQDFRHSVEEKQDIRALVFEGFARCVYPVQKFDSDTERRFAVLLEDDGDVLKWMKPARGLFTIRYRSDHSYEPDFVVETATEKFLIEVKRGDLMAEETVVAKAEAGKAWCAEATRYEVKHGGKPWHYLLVPDHAVKAGHRLKTVAGVHALVPEGAAAG